MRPVKRVLFLCTGNYYRSRFAEALFNHEARRRGLRWQAVSRGLAVHLVEGDLSPHAERGLRQRGIDLGLTGPTRRAVTEQDLAAASRVVALKEAEHRPLLRAAFPAWEERVTYWAIDDLDGACPEAALPELERFVLGLLDAVAHDEAALGDDDAHEAEGLRAGSELPGASG